MRGSLFSWRFSIILRVVGGNENFYNFFFDKERSIDRFDNFLLIILENKTKDLRLLRDVEEDFFFFIKISILKIESKHFYDESSNASNA